ncbi:hypothetical protein PHMEG_00015540 [Phytophthora megakarya]|uniref:Integrase catalytic domain-containing protein n=1 Tax=Phytophthora megakarya TaxID=4795 RepID=A0A225W111_9STRA|nr:hypothetical protein PHMEG_00015540 [Phytophthora megakarya]
MGKRQRKSFQRCCGCKAFEKTQKQVDIHSSPWINGSVERVNRDILQVFRAMILEYKFLAKTGSTLTAISISFEHGSPVNSSTWAYDARTKKLFKPPANTVAISKHLATLRKSLRYVHQRIADQRLRQRLVNNKRAHGENIVNFDVGDYVLRSRVDEKMGIKLHVTWQGPYAVVRDAPTHSECVI